MARLLSVSLHKLIYITAFHYFSDREKKPQMLMFIVEKSLILTNIIATSNPVPRPYHSLIYPTLSNWSNTIKCEKLTDQVFWRSQKLKTVQGRGSPRLELNWEKKDVTGYCLYLWGLRLGFSVQEFFWTPLQVDSSSPWTQETNK